MSCWVLEGRQEQEAKQEPNEKGPYSECPLPLPGPLLGALSQNIQTGLACAMGGAGPGTLAPEAQDFHLARLGEKQL